MGRPPHQWWMLSLAMEAIKDLGKDGIMVVFAKNSLDALCRVTYLGVHGDGCDVEWREGTVTVEMLW